MRKLFYIAVVCVALCFGAVGFLEGLSQKQEAMEKLETKNLNVAYMSLLVDFQNCMLSSINDTFYFGINHNPKEAMAAGMKIVNCRERLDELGKSVADEEMSGELGEALLFYDGYIETLNTILKLEFEVIDMYASGDVDSERLEVLVFQQRRAYNEAKKFLHRIQAHTDRVKVRLIIDGDA